jgi:TolB-like protein
LFGKKAKRHAQHHQGQANGEKPPAQAAITVKSFTNQQADQAQHGHSHQPTA